MNVLREDVRLAERQYPIEIGRNLRSRIHETCTALAEAGKKAVVVTDTHVAAAHKLFLATAFKGLPVLTLPPGEGTKSIESLERVYHFLATHCLERDSCLFALGGGVIGDLVGFAAATYLRGIAFYQVPTTLLAAVDSSVGGKTGINLPKGKNLIGVFHQPHAVFIDIALLETLPSREFNAGMSEVIKYGLLGDGAFFELLESIDPPLHPLHPKLPDIIRTCCALKATIVQNDEKEQVAEGGRALLNLGHTFGHAIETITGYHRYVHGEAIAIGLILAAQLSKHIGLITDAEVERIARLLQRYELPARLDPSPTAPKTAALIDAMRRDKKVRGGRLRFVVLQKIGQAVTVGDVDETYLKELWSTVGAES